MELRRPWMSEGLSKVQHSTPYWTMLWSSNDRTGDTVRGLSSRQVPAHAARAGQWEPSFSGASLCRLRTSYIGILHGEYSRGGAGYISQYTDTM